jgi:hypothetical protein
MIDKSIAGTPVTASAGRIDAYFRSMGWKFDHQKRNRAARPTADRKIDRMIGTGSPMARLGATPHGHSLKRMSSRIDE